MRASPQIVIATCQLSKTFLKFTVLRQHAGVFQRLKSLDCHQSKILHVVTITLWYLISKGLNAKLEISQARVSFQPLD